VGSLARSQSLIDASWTKARTGETVAVNAGFVPSSTQDRNQQDRVVAQLITDKPVGLTGYLRFPVAAGLFTLAGLLLVAFAVRLHSRTTTSS
jgi:hypothetical protein